MYLLLNCLDMAGEGESACKSPTQAEPMDTDTGMEAGPTIGDEAGLLTFDDGTMADPTAPFDDPNPLAERLAGVSIAVDTEVPEDATGTTAFFVFSSVHRQRVKAALQSHLQGSEKLGIGQIGKKIGVDRSETQHNNGTLPRETNEHCMLRGFHTVHILCCCDIAGVMLIGNTIAHCTICAQAHLMLSFVIMRLPTLCCGTQYKPVV